MSLLDIIAAAGEELIGLRALGGQAPAPDSSADRRIGRRFIQATMLSLMALALCWGVARLFPDSGARSAAAVGVYVALGLALFSALGWAYVRMVAWKATRLRRRDA